MDISDFTLISAGWLIIIFSLACALYLFMLLRERYAPREQALQKGVFFFFIFYAGIYIARLAYKWNPELFVIGDPFFYACHTFIGPTLYYILFKATSGETDKKFPRIHFILPMVMPVTIAVWLFFVPFEVPLGIVKGFRELNPDWPVFSHVFASIILSEILFDTVYLSLSLITLRRYQLSLSKAKREDRRYRMNWIVIIIVILLNTWIHPIIVLFTSMEAVYDAYWFTAPSALLIVSMQIVLLNNFQQRNYPPLDSRQIAIAQFSNKPAVSSVKIPAVYIPKTAKASPKVFSKKDFENYIKREKPFLDPKLKLTSLAREMSLSRDELSRFINRSYGINFNTFIGQWRLRELERLRRLKKNQDIPIKQLLPQAGFAYYNSYMRARQEAEDRDRNKEINKKQPTQDDPRGNHS